jgi:ribokinase
MSGRVIVVGSVNIDLIARVAGLPHPGETVTGGSFQRHHGGKGGNQAVAAARLGRPTLMIGAVGRDDFDVEARRALSSERVDVSMLASLPGQATGVALILVDAGGENEIAVIPGANGAIEAGYTRDSLARLGRLAGDVLLVSNEVPLHVVREALLCGHAAGAITVLNPAPATGIDRAIFGLADVVTPNRNELAMLLQTEADRTGRSLAGGTEITALARTLLEAGPEGPGVRQAVIVTLGPAGAMILEREGAPISEARTRAGAPVGRLDQVVATAAESAVHPAGATPGELASEPGEVRDESTSGADPCDGQAGGDGSAPGGGSAARATQASRSSYAAADPLELRGEDVRIWSIPAIEVDTIDSTGAGDAFCGALAAALAEGRPLAEAVHRAVAGAALTTTRVGARDGMPSAAELNAFLASR